MQPRSTYMQIAWLSGAIAYLGYRDGWHMMAIAMFGVWAFLDFIMWIILVVSGKREG